MRPNLPDKSAGAKHPGNEMGTPRFTRLMLDRADCVAFASTDIEQWLGRDYESVTGLHITALLPEMAACLGNKELNNRRMRQFQQMGEFRTYALHANGDRIPTIVTLQAGFWDSTIPLLLLQPVPPEPST